MRSPLRKPEVVPQLHGVRDKPISLVQTLGLHISALGHYADMPYAILRKPMQSVMDQSPP